MTMLEIRLINETLNANCNIKVRNAQPIVNFTHIYTRIIIFPNKNTDKQLDFKNKIY